MHNHWRYQSISCDIKEATKRRKVRWTKASTIIKSAFLLLWPLILTPGMPSRSLARFSDIPHWTLSRRCGFLSDKKTDLEVFLFLFLSQVHLKRTSLQRNKCLLDVKVRAGHRSPKIWNSLWFPFSSSTFALLPHPLVLVGCAWLHFWFVL